jgi:hypothetical protein
VIPDPVPLTLDLDLDDPYDPAVGPYDPRASLALPWRYITDAPA